MRKLHSSCGWDAPLRVPSGTRSTPRVAALRANERKRRQLERNLVTKAPHTRQLLEEGPTFSVGNAGVVLGSDSEVAAPRHGRRGVRSAACWRRRSEDLPARCLIAVRYPERRGPRSLGLVPQTKAEVSSPRLRQGADPGKMSTSSRRRSRPLWFSSTCGRSSRATPALRPRKCHGPIDGRCLRRPAAAPGSMPLSRSSRPLFAFSRARARVTWGYTPRARSFSFPPNRT